jgi:hypothetical protein
LTKLIRPNIRSYKLLVMRLSWITIQLVTLGLFVLGVRANFHYLSQAPLDLILEKTKAGDFVLLIDERSILREQGIFNGDQLLAIGEVPLTSETELRGALKMLREAPREPELTVQTGNQEPRSVQITRERRPDDRGYSPFQLAMVLNGMDILLVGSYVVLAWIIFLRKSTDAFTLLVTLTILLLGVRMTPQSEELGIIRPNLFPIVLWIYYLGTVLLATSLALFPNGRFVPHWSWNYVLAVLVYAFGYFIFPGFRTGYLSNQLLVILSDLLLFGFGVGLQVYRYLRFSNPIERQQTKWVVYGIGIGFLGLYSYQAANYFFPFLSGYTPGNLPVKLALRFFFTLSMVVAPVTLALSIFRYRLFDIDLIIRRTLLYSSLTATLAAVYFGSILLLEVVWEGASPERSSIAIIASTLLSAALFNPLRRRIQGDIDRRFYRRKYDAEQALAEFAQAARSETDRKALTELLVQVTEKTVQPQFVGLWLNQAGPKGNRPEALQNGLGQ